MRICSHVQRITAEILPKIMAYAKMEEGGRRERPRKWKLDDIPCDLRSLGIVDWKTKARTGRNGVQF